MMLPRQARAAIDDAVGTVQAATAKVSGYVMAAIGIAVLALVAAVAALIGVCRAAN
jgi:hypothetical protein